MARTILAAVAALCALAAVAGVPVVGEAPQQLQLQVLAANPALGDLTNEILNSINKTLTAVLEKVAEFENAAEHALDSIQEKIQQAEEQASQATKATIEKAAALGVDVTECVNVADQAIEAAEDESTNGSRQCLVNARQDVSKEVQQIRDLYPQAKALLQEAVDKVNECRQQVSIVELPKCLLESLPAIRTKIEQLATRVGQLAVDFPAKLSTTQSMFASCEQSVLTNAFTQIQAIYQTEANCIQGKISQAAGQ